MVPLEQSDRFIRALHKQRSGVQCHSATVKSRYHSSASYTCKFKLFGVTLYRHRESPVLSLNWSSYNKVYSSTGPMHSLRLRNPG
jgi:hypothetical protein